jgi:ATP-dependent exoDNAse (exonuclease V) beta subunit
MNHVLKVYKASAGSGKTFRLAVHYIKLLVENDGGGEYAHILAVTFTNKATTEMKDRIISQLYGIGHALPKSQAYYAELCKALEADGRTDLSVAEIRRRCREALHAILHDYNRFRVSTIDAFFQMILRGLAHELGLTANLQVEISDTEVLSEAVDRIVEKIVRKREEVRS